MVVLRDSYFSRCGCLAIVEETESGVVDRICIPDPRRNCIDQEAISGRTHKARTLLVVEAMVSLEKSDCHKHSHVHSYWCFDWTKLEMERASGCCRVEHGNRGIAADKPKRSL